MLKQQSLKGISRPRQEFNKGKPKLIVDEYDSLNLMNTRSKQQLMICGFCSEEIPERLMISHKKVCMKLQKNDYTYEKIERNISMEKINKGRQKEEQKQYRYQSVKNQLQKNMKKKRIESQCKNYRQSAPKTIVSKEVKNSRNMSSNKSNQKGIKLTQSMHSANCEKKQLKRPRQNSSKNSNAIFREKREEPILISNRNYPSNIKKTSAPYKRKGRNFAQNNISNNVERVHQQKKQINPTPNIRQTTNSRNRNRQHRRDQMNMGQSQTRNTNQRYHENRNNTNNHHQSTINCITHTLNEQFSMINSHFNMMNQVFSNFSSFIPNVYDQSSEYYFQNPIHTMFFENFEQSSDSSFDNEVEEQNQGLEEEVIHEIPKSRYPKTQKQQQCTICLSDIKEKEIVKNLECAHLFHADCIDEWLRRKAACPVCREQL